MLLKYRYIIFLLLIVVLAIVFFCFNQQKVRTKQVLVKNETSDTLEVYETLNPVSSFNSDNLLTDLNKIVFSNNAKYVFQWGEDGKEFITRFEIKDNTLVNKMRVNMKGLNLNFIYEIFLLKDNSSENLMAICIPMSQDLESMLWRYDSLNLLDVILYSQDLKEISRRKVKLRNPGTIDFENTFYLKGGYVFNNDVIAFLDSYGTPYLITTDFFEKFEKMNLDLRLRICSKNYQIHDDKNELEISDLNSEKVFRYKLKSDAHDIYFVDSGFMVETSGLSFERYKAPFN